MINFKCNFPFLSQEITFCGIVTLDFSFRGELKSWFKAQHSENKDYGIRSHHFMANRWRNSGQCQTLFFGAPKSLQMLTATMKLKDSYFLEEKL